VASCIKYILPFSFGLLLLNLHISSGDQVDLRGSLKILAGEYETPTVHADRGGLVNEIRLLIHPGLAGGNAAASFWCRLEIPFPMRMCR